MVRANRRTVAFMLGATFLLSGFVKGVDPMGLIYKLEEYLVAFGWVELNTMSAALAILLCSVEIALGLLLLLGKWQRFTAISCSIFMVVFTILTYAIYTNPYVGITECGCFGDAFMLSNAETFWKNVVLMLLAIMNIYFVFKSRVRESKSLKTTILVAVFALGLPIYSLAMLPPFDFLDYNVGAKSTISLYDDHYEDITEQLATNSDKPLYLIGARKLITEQDIRKIAPLMARYDSGQIDLVAISSNSKNIELLSKLPRYYIDDVVLKSLIRSSKGTVLISDGVIRGKWILGDSSPLIIKIRVWGWWLLFGGLLIIIFISNRKRVNV